MDKLMICYDGSPTARAVVEKTVDLYMDTKPEINLVIVADYAGAVGHSDDKEWVKKYEDTLETRAQWIREQGFEASTHFYRGNVKEKVVEAVEEIAPDVAVVGRMGDTKMQRAILGTISEELVKHSPCPVLVV